MWQIAFALLGQARGLFLRVLFLPLNGLSPVVPRSCLLCFCVFVANRFCISSDRHRGLSLRVLFLPFLVAHRFYPHLSVATPRF